MRRVLPLLLLALLGHRDNARAIMALRTRATRPPTAPSDLAFASPPTVPQSPGRRKVGEGWTSRSSNNNNNKHGLHTPSGGTSSRDAVCPLTLTRRRRGGGGGDTAQPPPTSSPLTRTRRKRKGATAPAAAATKAAPVRLEPLRDITSSSSSGVGGRNGAGPSQARPPVVGAAAAAGAPA
ncbi:unnamed protein product, partial [Scytosiphon promiscuus]